ncbi:mitochondrial ribosomal protein L41 [Lycorma delicatula]|uniref:mitochondrial ribosomal protein L41 n=1 Tax=Lycorma delicatula TaxID=130591 RepID=UPI003F516FCE
MASLKFLVINCRNFSTSHIRNGKKNFRKFILRNRGPQIFKEKQKVDPDPDVPIYNYGVREVRYFNGEKYVVIPEKIPEIVVPDLTGFTLKPYVSYRVPDIVQPEFTPEQLFNAVYRDKIEKDFKEGKLDDNGNSLEPSEEEKLTPEEAKIKARQTGSDLFCPRSKREEEELFDNIFK